MKNAAFALLLLAAPVAAQEQLPPEGPAETLPVGEGVPPTEGTPLEAPAKAQTDAPAEAAETPAEPPAASAPPAVAPPPAPVRIDEITVVGKREQRVPGSAHTLRPKELERFRQDDAHAVFKLVPGVYTRGEDGLGLRPNIGLRGATSDRSKKVTLMEDGILFAPAPYSAPAAYYFPLPARLETIRVLKGPASIVYGPQTLGGAIDLITRPIPDTSWGAIDLAGGEHRYGKLHGHYGASYDGFGFLIEGAHLRTDGFKELDGGGDTGFDRSEIVGKARYRLPAFLSGDTQQTLHLKVGYGQEDSDETYLGLTDEDFRRTPLRRYGASRLDHMSWWRTQASVAHDLTYGELKVTTTAYRNDFSRSWRKLNRFRGAELLDVLADPTSAVNEAYYGVLTLQQDTLFPGATLMIGPNERRFVSQGVQSTASWQHRGPVLVHDVQFGARFHHDRVNRRHTEDGFLVQAGELVRDDLPTVVNAHNWASTHALATWLTDAVTWRRLTLTPGLRIEHIQSRAVDRRTATRTNDDPLTVVIPGMGAFVELAPALGALAGVHRGFTPTPPGRAAGVDPENSINYEAGLRYMTRPLRAEVIGFFNDYRNLTNICSFSSGCADQNIDQQFDAGRARVWGAEAFLASELRPLRGLAVPVNLAYTYTRTRFLEAFSSTDPLFGDVEKGDEFSYVPRHQGSLTVGAETRRFGLAATGSYTGRMREIAGVGPVGQNLATDSLFLIDAVARARFLGWLEVYLNLRNVTNTQRIVAHRPFGARPNAPRWLQLGVKATF